MRTPGAPASTARCAHPAPARPRVTVPFRSPYRPPSPSPGCRAAVRLTHAASSRCPKGSAMGVRGHTEGARGKAIAPGDRACRGEGQSRAGGGVVRRWGWARWANAGASSAGPADRRHGVAAAPGRTGNDAASDRARATPPEARERPAPSRRDRGGPRRRAATGTGVVAVATVRPDPTPGRARTRGPVQGSTSDTGSLRTANTGTDSRGPSTDTTVTGTAPGTGTRATPLAGTPVLGTGTDMDTETTRGPPTRKGTRPRPRRQA